MSGDQDYPLSFEQESIWVAERFAAGPSPYVESWAQRLRGHLDAGALTWALRQIVIRHPALRSRFLLAGDDVVQRTGPGTGFAVETADWRGRGLDEAQLGEAQLGEAQLGEALRAAAQRPLDIREVTFRASLAELAPDDHVLLVQCHHIVVDDYSLDLLAAEIKALYTPAAGGGPPGLPGLPALAISPGEYAAGQRARGIPAPSLEHWARYLDGVQQTRTLLPAGRLQQPQRPRRGSRCGRVTAAVDSDVAGRIQARARAMRTTPTVIFLASLAMALAASSGAEDVVLGQPVSRRGPAQLEGVFGCFTDIMPLRLQVPPDLTFTGLCAAAKRGVISALSHREVPWAAIVKRLRSPKSALSGSGLISVALVVEETTRLTLPGLDCERIYVVPAAVKFDWCVYVVAAAGSYSCYVDYASDLLTPDEAARALRQWTRTLAEVSQDPDLTAAALRRTLGSAGGWN